MNKNYKKMFETLNEYLKNKIEDIDQTIIEAVNARNNGKCFSFQEHLKGFVYAQLSANTSSEFLYAVVASFRTSRTA